MNEHKYLKSLFRLVTSHPRPAIKLSTKLNPHSSGHPYSTPRIRTRNNKFHTIESINKNKRGSEVRDLHNQQRKASFHSGAVSGQSKPFLRIPNLQDIGPRPSIDTNGKTSRGGASILGIVSTVAGVLSITIFLFSRITHAEGLLQSAGKTELNRSDKGGIRLSELSQHTQHDATRWVIRGTRVYDITNFIAAHPGGDVILRACGGSVDPYWKIFNLHQKKEVLAILEQYYIGDIDARDLDANGEINWAALGSDRGRDIADPFADDPERDPQLVVHNSKPCNAETPGRLLADSFLTPIHLFFVRNHLWVPRIDAHSLVVELPDGSEKVYDLTELKSKFKEHTVTTTLQCAGNRRSHISSSAAGPTSGIQWDIGAIGTAEFTGILLRDVLIDAGYDLDIVLSDSCDSGTNESTNGDLNQHIHFISPGDTYVASVPLATAMSPLSDVLLAYRMNGEPLPRDHGGPLRAIVPGAVAARSVKWVGCIRIDSEESNSQWQRRDYKCFGPNVRASDVKESDWDNAMSIQELPVQSAITTIKEDDMNEENIKIQGYAVSGGGRGIVRVDVSTDGGLTWQQAQLHQNKSRGSRKWAWTLWSLTVPNSKLEHPKEGDSLVVKAVDEAYNTQPERFEPIWNFRGLLGNAWHRVEARWEGVKEE
ncbi:hypothetical protein MYCGRDRAFT_101503 [Paecilomyces variotii No. 5]|uniref:Nitrate reductase [NADPH] n=1 Tax=Byssochlamys spectabilis (strain No. 5 / NBRC 109023) TaxID=1356009 RepID=V5FPR2_BYSSN|nr:hypothetical protein MYCGRDRAFT_101503 [Paecilomyces variotii No. 5]